MGSQPGRRTARLLPAIGVIVAGLAAAGMLLLHAEVYSDPVVQRFSAAFRRAASPHHLPTAAGDGGLASPGVLPAQDPNNYPKVPHFEATAGWLQPPLNPVHPQWRMPPEPRRYANCDAVRLADGRGDTGTVDTAAVSVARGTSQHAASVAGKWGELVRGMRGGVRTETRGTRTPTL